MVPKKKYIPEEWIGKRYGHLTIVGYSKKMFDCVCDCGNTKRTKPSFLFNGKVKTCGYGCPYHQEQYDRRSKESLYGTWNSMLQRCYNSNSHGYYLYGGRGIAVCDEWKSDFWAFNEWALNNGYEPGLSIDRIDSDGNYEPINCRWATAQQQRNNSRDPYTFKEKPPKGTRHNRAIKHMVFGEELSMPEISKKYGLSAQMLHYRVKKGMTLEEAIQKPKSQGKKIPL